MTKENSRTHTNTQRGAFVPALRVGRGLRKRFSRFSSSPPGSLLKPFSLWMAIFFFADDYINLHKHTLSRALRFNINPLIIHEARSFPPSPLALHLSAERLCPRMTNRPGQGSGLHVPDPALGSLRRKIHLSIPIFS